MGMAGTRNRRTKETGKVISTTKVTRTLVVHNLLSVEIYLRLCAISQTGAPEAQPAQLSSWRYGRRARTIYFAGSFSDSDEATSVVTSSNVPLFESSKRHPAREIGQGRRTITDITNYCPPVASESRPSSCTA